MGLLAQGIFPFLDMSYLDWISLALLFWPIVWQLLRGALGLGLMWWARKRGPLGMFPLAEKCALENRPVRGGRMADWPINLWAAGAALLAISPIMIPAIYNLYAWMTWQNSFTEAKELFILFIIAAFVIEMLAGSSAAINLVIARRPSESHSSPLGDVPPPPPGADPPAPSFQSLLALSGPWMIITTLLFFLYFGVENNNPILRNFLAIFISAPIGIFFAVFLGWEIGLRARTASGAACLTLWIILAINGVISGLLSAALCWGSPGFELLNLFSVGKFLASRPELEWVRLIVAPFAFSMDNPAMDSNFFLASLGIWTGRLIQVGIAFVLLGWLRAQGRKIDFCAKHPWGGVAFRWPWMLRGNPIWRRSLNVPPYGGHHAFTWTRLGLFLILCAFGGALFSLAIQGLDHPRPSSCYWALQLLIIGLSLIYAHGIVAAFFGMIIARRAASTNENQDIYLTALSNEEIIAGRIGAAYFQSLLYVLGIPLFAVWPLLFKIADFGKDETIVSCLIILYSIPCYLSLMGDCAYGVWRGARSRTSVTAGLAAIVYGFGMSLSALFSLAIGSAFGWNFAESSLDAPNSSWLCLFCGLYCGLWAGFLPILTRFCTGDAGANLLVRQFLSQKEMGEK